MAIDTTTSVDVQTLTPFKKFIMTLGSLPTSYLESMTYAELVMWFCNYLQETVIPTINNNADAIIELQEWFNNLDVTEEVANILDKMAEDGTLTSLIKDYVDPIYLAYENQINSEIQEIDNKVTSAISGTPKGVYETVSALETADPDHDYIYVVTADGKWYYYDESTSLWTAGGTYQASVDSDTVDILESKVDSLDSMENYTYNQYFESFTQGRITAGFNTKYAYSDTITNKGTSQIYFDDTTIKLMIYKADSEGNYDGTGTGWLTTSPATFDRDYEYFGVEVQKLDGNPVTAGDIANFLATTYAVENPTLQIVDDVNQLKSDVSNLIDINDLYMFNKMAGVGDSLISGSLVTDSINYTNYDNSWVAFLARRYSADFKHYSKGGLTTKSWLSSECKTQLENDPASNTYFISLGTNDKNQSEYTIGNITDQVGADSFVGYYKQIINIIHTKNPNAVIFCVSMYDDRDVSEPYTQMVSDIADLYSYCYFIDFIGNTEHTSKETSLYANNSHFTTIGYIYVANIINGLLNTIVSTNDTDFKWFGVNN